jgi:hypothetical protein
MIGQSPLPGTSYPATGEIDLMKYAASRSFPPGYLDRSIAAEEDVKSLLWLARIKFE